jgi:hypothetical protein
MQTSTVLRVFTATLAGVLMGGASPDASATLITIDAANRGWIDEFYMTSPTNNYLTGNCCDAGEHRSFFQFAIPTLPEPIASARLILDTAKVDVLQGPSMTLIVTSLPSVFGFSDLGMGALYGSRSYSAADAYTTRSIDLSPAALESILASELGTFGTSQRISAGATFGPDIIDQFVFGRSNRGEQSVQLEITLVPEPSTALLVGMGLVATSASRRRLRVR